MATITRKRPRGARKAVHNVEHARQSTANATVNDGIGQGSERPLAAQKEPVREKQGCTFERLVATVLAEPRLVASCWHPKPTGNSIGRPDSDVRVLTGDAAYQLSNGEIIRL